MDGEGTLITTESCLLHPSRNPGMTKDEIEQDLKDYLGVEKVIWLVSGLGLEEDPDTDGHVDGVAAFIGPARVLLHMVRDPRHAGLRQPAGEPASARDDRCTRQVARGRRARAAARPWRRRPRHRRDLRQLLPGERRCDRAHGRQRRRPSRPRVPARDLAGREVVGVPTPVVGYGGGGIHCITQQVPARDGVRRTTRPGGRSLDAATPLTLRDDA